MRDESERFTFCGASRVRLLSCVCSLVFPSTAFEPRFGSNQGYLSTEEIGVFINETVDRLPAGFARIEKIGTSVQGRPILALCLGACHSTVAVPQALYTGMHHSREVCCLWYHCLMSWCLVLYD